MQPAPFQLALVISGTEILDFRGAENISYVSLTMRVKSEISDQFLKQGKICIE